jgi:hypothetical protein
MDEDGLAVCLARGILSSELDRMLSKPEIPGAGEGSFPAWAGLYPGKFSL